MRSRADREAFAAFLMRARAGGFAQRMLIDAVEWVPRREFIPDLHHKAAYSDQAIPIECGETIEGLDFQVRMLKALELESTHHVLEVGTGTGYTAALFSRLVRRVSSIERFRTLRKSAAARHEHLGLDNIIVHHTDGHQGFEQAAPYDRIIVWAAFEEIPRKFAELLALGGLMIAPVGPGGGLQTMMRLEKIGNRFEKSELETTRLQPLATSVALAL